MSIESKPNVKRRFGIAIRKRRQELDISQEELADRAGLHRTYISDIERGARNVSIENIEKIAVALRISISDLFASYGVESKECGSKTP